jgi:hypothetical protein
MDIETEMLDEVDTDDEFDIDDTAKYQTFPSKLNDMEDSDMKDANVPF